MHADLLVCIDSQGPDSKKDKYLCVIYSGLKSIIQVVFEGFSSKLVPSLPPACRLRYRFEDLLGGSFQKHPLVRQAVVHTVH